MRRGASGLCLEQTFHPVQHQFVTVVMGKEVIDLALGIQQIDEAGVADFGFELHFH